MVCSIFGSTLDERYYFKGDNEITFRDIIINGIQEIDSIMCDQFGKENNIRHSDKKATDLDLQMALQAYKSDQWQYWYVWTTPKS